jgi:hypothetical protein
MQIIFFLMFCCDQLFFNSVSEAENVSIYIRATMKFQIHPTPRLLTPVKARDRTPSSDSGRFTIQISSEFLTIARHSEKERHVASRSQIAIIKLSDPLIVWLKRKKHSGVVRGNPANWRDTILGNGKHMGKRFPGSIRISIRNRQCVY